MPAARLPFVRLLVLTTIFIFASLSSPASAQDKKFPTISSLLPHREVTAEVVQARSTPEIIAITKKFQTALKEKVEWWNAYVKANANVRPLPYHKNFGITEEKYGKLQQSAKFMRLVKVQDVKLIAKRTGDLLELSITGADKQVNALVFDLKKGSLKTPMATIPKATQRDSGKKGGLLGHHLAYKWEKTIGDPAGGTYQVVSFTLGRRSSTGSTFIQYQAAKVKDGKPGLRFDVLMFIERDKVGS